MTGTIPRTSHSISRAAWTRRSVVVLTLVLVGAAPAMADTKEHYRAGLGLLARGLNQEAATELRTYLEAAPDATDALDARYALAVCLVRLDRTGDALSTLRAIPEEAAFAFAADALFLRARLAFEANDDEAAAATLARLAAAHPTFPRLAEAERIRGEALLRAGRPIEARATLLAALERWPNDPQQARLELLCGAAEAASGDDAQAADRLGRLRRAKGDPAIAHTAALLEAQALHRLGRWADCVAACLATGLASASFASDSPAAVLRRSALLHLGDEALAQDHNRQAEEHLTALVAAAPNEELPPALLRLATAIDHQGRPAEALALFERVATTSGPESAYARLAAADALVALGRHDEATAALESMVGRGSTAATVLRAAALDRLASRATASGRSEEAARWQAELLALEGADRSLRSRAGLELARLRLESNDPAAALEALDAAEALPRGDAPIVEDEALTQRAAYLRGVCLARLERHAAAAAALAVFAEPQASEGPSSELAVEGKILLGESRLAAGDAPGAIDVFNPLLAGPTLERMPTAMASTALLRLGDACTATQRWTEAEDAFTRFLDRFAAHELWFQAAFGQGFARERQGRHEAAIESYRTVVERHEGPTAARSRFQIGECLFAMGRLDEAVREFVKVDVLHGSPEWGAAALYEAGRCLAEQGRLTDARRQYESVASRANAGTWAELARARLAELAPAPLPGRS